MKKLAALCVSLVVLVSLASCIDIAALCAVEILAESGVGKICLDKIFPDGGVPANGDFCYCDVCGGIAADNGGFAGYHNFKNSTSHGPCPGIGGTCRSAGFSLEDGSVVYHDMARLTADIGSLADLGEVVLHPPDMSVVADMTISLALDFSHADLNTGCHSKIASAEDCRLLDKKNVDVCLNRLAMNDPTLSWLVSCVMNTCPKAKFADACVVNACAVGCCDALIACN